MVTERKTIGMISVLSAGQFQVREDTIIERDGIELTRTYHRTTFEPGADVSNQHEWVQKIASAIWTQELIEARKAQINKALASMPPFAQEEQK